MPFASLNWLADIGTALFNSSVKYSQIVSICPKISIKQGSGDKDDAIWVLAFVCPKLKGAFELSCWRQNKHSLSKFVCWNDKEDSKKDKLIS